MKSLAIFSLMLVNALADEPAPTPSPSPSPSFNDWSVITSEALRAYIHDHPPKPDEN